MKENINITKKDILIEFLRKTKNGEYALVEDTALPYARMNIDMEDLSCNSEVYYYGVS